MARLWHGSADNGTASHTAPPKSTKAPAAPARTYERPRGGEARAIADLTPAIGRTAFRRFGFVQSSVVSRWGKRSSARPTAGHCAPELIRFPPGEKSEGILQLVVTPAHAPLIQHVIPEIMERVNQFFGYRAVARVEAAARCRSAARLQ
jgi:hypothetical protein